MNEEEKEICCDYFGLENEQTRENNNAETFGNMQHANEEERNHKNLKYYSEEELKRIA